MQRGDVLALLDVCEMGEGVKDMGTRRGHAGDAGDNVSSPPKQPPTPPKRRIQSRMEARSTSCSSSSTCLEYCRRSTPCGDTRVTVGGGTPWGWGRYGAGDAMGQGVYGADASGTHRLQGLLHQCILQVGLDVNWGGGGHNRGWM